MTEQQTAAPRLPALDALRAVGATAVVACHVGFNTGMSGSGFWGGFLARFDSGVAIFFALSGFLLFRPFAHAKAVGGKRPGSMRYLWKRALRILPAYWAAVAAYLLILKQASPVTQTTWIEHLTLTQVYGFGRFAEAFGHTWSLCTEVAFYAVLPILAGLVLIGRWRPVRVVAVLAGVGISVTTAWMVLMAAGVINSSPQGLWLPSYAGWFCAGMALAAIHVALATKTGPASFRVLDEIASAPVACWLVAAGVLAVATTPIAGPRDLFSPTTGEFAAKTALYTVVAVMLLIPLAFGGKNRFTKLFSSGLARWLGTVSYGLFLWHPLVIAIIYRPDGGRPLFTGSLIGTFTLVLALGLLVATVSYYVLERPFQLLANLGRGPRHRTGHGGKPEHDDSAQRESLGERVGHAVV
jgi:peptidoglycan/LPS O-acetylase OafA/YrhL